MSTKYTDFVKTPPRTQYEAWVRWMNWMESQFRTMPYSKRVRIVVK